MERFLSGTEDEWPVSICQKIFEYRFQKVSFIYCDWSQTVSTSVPKLNNGLLVIHKEFKEPNTKVLRHRKSPTSPDSMSNIGKNKTHKNS
jgi:hypothetical protein